MMPPSDLAPDSIQQTPSAPDANGWGVSKSLT